MKGRRFYKRIFAVFATLLIAVSMIPISGLVLKAESINATKKVEILISSKTDAAYTTDNYKTDLLAELISRGYTEENIRFIESVDNIKTTSLSDSNWALYDHLNYIDPFADEATVYTTLTTTSTASVKNRDRHIYSLNNGKELVFLGYGSPAYKDFAIYKSDSADTKVINFDISADKVDTHTLEGSGFLVNAGVTSGTLKGYLLFYNFTSSTSGNVYLLKLNTNADAMHNSASGTMVSTYGTSVVSSVPFTFDSSTNKINVSMTVSPTSIKCSYTKYVKDIDGNVINGTTTSLFDYTIPTLDITGENGFGPLVSYTSHGCSSLTMFTFSNLSMSVSSSADNALKQTTWSDDSTVEKYYLNITDDGLGASGTENSKLSSIIDNSVYYIGAGTLASQAQSDVDMVYDMTGSASFVTTNPGSSDSAAIEAMADIIEGKVAKTPLVVEEFTKDESDTYSVDVSDDQTSDTPVAKTYEVVYKLGDGTVKTIIKTGVPALDGTKQTVTFTKTEIENSNWFVVREMESIVPVHTKLLTTEDIVSPVVSFNIKDAGSNTITSHVMTDAGITLNINDLSYSSSVVDIDGSNCTTTYTITKPDGTSINASSIALTKENAQTGDYKFTVSIVRTSDSAEFKVTKKVAIYNDSAPPTITRVSTAISGGKVTGTKTITVAFADAESGIYKYAIKATTASDINDFSSDLKSVSSKDSGYYEATYTLPISPDGEYNVFAYVIDKGGNEVKVLVDTYEVTIAEDAALTDFNAADEDAEVETAIQTHNEELDLPMELYDYVTDKSDIYSALKGETFTTKEEIKATFEEAVVLEALSKLKIEMVQIYDDYTTDYTLTKLNSLADIIEQLSAFTAYLTEDDLEYLTTAADKVDKAIIVKTKKEEEPSIIKDPLVIILEDMVNNLPDPVLATDEQILAKQNEISAAKDAYDDLGTKKSQVSYTIEVKLDKLVSRLAKINIWLDATKAKTNIAATGLGLVVTKEEIISGLDVKVHLDVENKTATEPHKIIVEAIAGDGRTIGAYFDINLYKQVGNDSEIKLTETDSKITITIEIPEELRGMLNYKIIRVHDGVAELLDTTIDGNYLTFETDRFSTYAIAFDSPVISPATGDYTPILLLFILPFAALGSIIFISIKKRKSI